MSEAALDDPSLSSKPGPVFGATACDHGFDPAGPQQPPVLVMVIATISDHLVGLLAGTPSLAGDRPAAQLVQQRHQLGDVVAIPAGQRDGERDPGRVDEQMVL